MRVDRFDALSALHALFRSYRAVPGREDSLRWDASGRSSGSSPWSPVAFP